MIVYLTVGKGLKCQELFFRREKEMAYVFMELTMVSLMGNGKTVTGFYFVTL